MLSETQIQQFLDDAAMLGTAESFLAFTATNATSRELVERVSSGAVTDDVMETFVQALLATFEPGRQFQADKVLGLVAHSIRHRPGRFACRFLEELSELNCAEIPFAPRVARSILKERRRLVSPTVSNEQNMHSNAAKAERTSVSWSDDAHYSIGSSYERVRGSVGARFVIDATKPVSDWKQQAA